MPSRLFSAGLLALVVALAGWAVVRYSFTADSRVWVEGSSTVHDWDCEASRVSATMDAAPGSGALASISGLTLTIPVAQLDCDNGTMNKKLRGALGTSPVRFQLTDTAVGNLSNGRFGVRATGRVTIKGTSRTKTFTVIGRPLGGDRYRFTGSVPLTMTEFGVEPPRALAGALRTHDPVTVKFDVIAAR